MQESNYYIKLIFTRHLILDMLRIRHYKKLLLCIHISGIHCIKTFKMYVQRRRSLRQSINHYAISVRRFNSMFDVNKIYILLGTFRKQIRIVFENDRFYKNDKRPFFYHCFLFKKSFWKQNFY